MEDMDARLEAAEEQDPRGTDHEAPAYVTWTQRDGTPIQVRRMDDLHLYHTIRLLERGAKTRCRRAEEKQRQCMDRDLPAFDYAPEQFEKPILKVMRAVAIARGIQL